LEKEAGLIGTCLALTISAVNDHFIFTFSSLRIPRRSEKPLSVGTSRQTKIFSRCPLWLRGDLLGLWTYPFHLLSNSSRMKKIQEITDEIAQTDITVLIKGKADRKGIVG
jgi:hypothetical protein